MSTGTPLTTPDLQPEMVRLYNKTERKFSHELTLDGKKTKYELPAGTFARVPKQVADLWLGMFPNEIVTDAEAHASINGMRSELEAAQKRIEELEKSAAESAKPAKPRKAKSLEVV